LDKRLFAKLSVLCLVSILLGVSIGVVYAQSSSNYMTITGGIYPGAPSHTISVTDGVYYAKNSYGAVSWSSTNAAYVIETANSYGTTYLTNGIYNIEETINIKHSLIGEDKDGGENLNGVILNYIPAAGDCLLLENVTHITLRDFTINIDSATFSGNAIHYLNTAGSFIEQCLAENLEIWNGQADQGGIGILIETRAGGFYFNDFVGLNIRGFETGVKLYRNGGGGITATNFDNIKCIVCINGFEFETDSIPNIQGNSFSDVHIQSWTNSEYGFKNVIGHWFMFKTCFVWDAPAGFVSMNILEDTLNTQIIGGDLVSGTQADRFFINDGTGTQLAGIAGLKNSGISQGTGNNQTMYHSLLDTPDRVFLTSVDWGANPRITGSYTETAFYVTAESGYRYYWQVEVLPENWATP